MVARAQAAGELPAASAIAPTLEFEGEPFQHQTKEYLIAAI